MNTAATIDIQAKQLVAQMSLEEKTSLCSGEDFWHLKGCERLSLPTIMVTDGPHGMRKQRTGGDHLGIFDSVPATCFPTASALASSWDSQLINRVGKALGAECLEEDIAVLLGPGLNIKRHPLGGRNFEYVSEDPLLSGKLSAALVNGIQSQGVGACLKHFAVNNQEAERMTVDAVVDERTMHEIYLRGFEIAIEESSPWTIMCAYNRLNGEYCSQNTWLNETILRDEWHYDGLMVTDWMAMDDRVAGVVAGMDLEMPGNGGQNDRRVLNAVKSGALDIAELDKVAQRVTKLIIRAVEGRRKAKANSSPLNLSLHNQLAREAASKSAVLLKNDDNLLPLTSNASIAIIGEFAKKPRYQGSGSSLVTPTQLDNAWDALEKWAQKNNVQLQYAPGYDAVHSAENKKLVDEAVSLAAQADIVIIFAGLPSQYESEGIDRPHCNLPDQQNKLIDAVASANTFTAVALSNGAAVTMPWLPKVSSVLECYLSGQAGGSACVDILTGAVNPSGKLTETFAITQEDHLCDEYFPGHPKQVEYREGLYVGYRYFNSVNKPVLFPFGFGMSYTTFEYGKAQLSHDTFNAKSQDVLKVTGEISNTGALSGEEVVQVYVEALDSKVHRPKHVLAGFAKLNIDANKSASYEIDIDERSFGFYCINDKRWKTESGEYEIQVGASSKDIKSSIRITVIGEEIVKVDSDEQRFFTNLNAELTTVSDDVFSSSLGKTIPSPSLAHPFHQNSTISEIQTTWLGRKLLERIRKKIHDDMNPNDDEDANLIMDRAVPAMPLRGIVLGSEGKVSFKQLDGLIHLLNGNYWKAFCSIFQKK